MVYKVRLDFHQEETYLVEANSSLEAEQTATAWAPALRGQITRRTIQGSWIEPASGIDQQTGLILHGLPAPKPVEGWIGPV